MDSNSKVKQEQPEHSPMESVFVKQEIHQPASSASSRSSSDSNDLSAYEFRPKRNMDDDDDHDGLFKKKQRREKSDFLASSGFPEPVPLRMAAPIEQALPLRVFYNDHDHHEAVSNHSGAIVKYNVDDDDQVAPAIRRGCKQFWKAGDYEQVNNGAGSTDYAVGMDHVRVHPKFLHSNATSHKWALGAFSELLDNTVDEIANGATYVNVNVLRNQKDGSEMLLVEDNGGGMTPDKMRQCMSLGYSAKSKIANTIGQYGNGFKTSTMRLGEDVIVFSRSLGSDGKSQTQSIGLLSYSFLKATGKEDIVVPMIDFEKRGRDWNKKIRYSLSDWDMNLETILEWSPFINEQDLLQQFDFPNDQGTRIIIYNLWEDDEGNLELDFGTDPHDIQVRGVNRDKNSQMGKEYPSSKHFFTYQHSLRSYASILYRRLPPDFRIILRGKDVKHHDIENDMTLAKTFTYKPVQVTNGSTKNRNIVAIGKIGFVRDAVRRIDIQGFNVYHKNRLIKPFWRVWNAAGSGGRGAIGVLEANFVEPAHDKQGFERTTALSRLEARLLKEQKDYWNENCQRIGYAARRHKNPPPSNTDYFASNKDTVSEHANQNGQCSTSGDRGSPVHVSTQNQKGSTSTDKNSPLDKPINQNGEGFTNGDPKMRNRMNFGKISPVTNASKVMLPYERNHQMTSSSRKMQVVVNKDGQVNINGNGDSLTNLKNENHESSSKRIDDKWENYHLLKCLRYERERRQRLESQLMQKANELEARTRKIQELDHTNQELDRTNCFLSNELEAKTRTIQELDHTNCCLLDRIQELEHALEEERSKNASKTFDDLQQRQRQQEVKEAPSCKIEKD